MPSLMDLPLELRDQICLDVIQSSKKKPPNLNHPFDALIASRTRDRLPCHRSWSNLALYLEDDNVANTSSLLRVNRRLRTETLSNMKRAAKNCTYELDIILLDEILPLPTWTCVPVLTTRLDQVTVSFRVSGTYDPDKEYTGLKHDEDPSTSPYMKYGRYKGFKNGGDGAGPALSWQIYSILERFLEIGPQSLPDENHEHRDMVVKTIEINVETPPDSKHKRFGNPTSGDDHGSQHPYGTVLHPLHLYRFISRHLKSLVTSSDHEWHRYGRILFEHVDYIWLLMNGKRSDIIDVASSLKDQTSFRENDLSKEALQAYKEKTWKLRKERGLIVPEDLIY